MGARVVNRTSTLALVALISLLATAPLQAQEMLPSAAVLSFRVLEDMEPTTAEALANIVRHEVLQSGRLTLIDRDRTEAVLLEQGFMMAGGCYDVSCLVQMGKVLGAERVITGSINRLGRKYIIELRAANVGSGQIEALETREYTGSVEEITDPVRDLAISLVNILTRKKGVLIVDTKPSECIVSIDDSPLGFAPVSIIRPGGVAYHVRAARSGYQDATEKVMIPEGDTLKIELKLERAVTRNRRYREPQFRLMAAGGFPLKQASTNFSSDLSWGTGESYGAFMQFGSEWRLGFGAYMYEGEIPGVDEQVWYDYGATGLPRGNSNVYYASLNLFLGNGGFAPFGGAGLAVMDRFVTTDLIIGGTEKYEAKAEIGWMLMLGLEIEVMKYITTQVYVVHAKSLAEDQSWWEATETSAEPPRFWVDSFQQFQSFTALHLAVGVKF